MRSLLFVLLPPEALPLIIALAGIGIIVGILKPKAAFALIGLFILSIVLVPFIEELFGKIPPGLLLLMLVGFGLWIVRTVLTAMLGAEGAGHVLGHAFIGLFRGILWLLLLPLRLTARLITIARRGAQRGPNHGAPRRLL